MALTNCYTTVDALAAEMEINGTDQARLNSKLERAIAAACRLIDAETGWHQHGFWQDSAVVARTFEPDDTRCLYISEGISTTTGLIVKTDTDGNGTYETTLTISTDFILEPVNAAANYPVWPYTEIRIRSASSAYFPTGLEDTVQVTAKFGWPAVPDDVAKAALIQAMLEFKAGDAVFGGVQLGIDGSVLRMRTGLHPTAAGLIERYQKPRVA